MKGCLFRIVSLIIQLGIFNYNLVLAQSITSEISNQITIKHFKIEGSQLTSEIKSLLSSYLNQEVSLDKVSEIKDAIDRFYQTQGYFVSFAFIPLQDFAGGIVRIRVVEGKLTDIQVEGNSTLSDKYIKVRLKKSLASVPLKLKTLETELQLLQQNPQIERVKAELRPGQKLGQNVLFLNIEESPTTTTIISANNDFSPQIGELGATGAVEKRSLLLEGDLALAKSSFTEGLEQYLISYGIPLNSAEGMLSLQYQNAQSDIVEEPLDTADIKGKVEQIALLYRQPLYKSLTEEFTSILGFDITSVDSFLRSDFPFSFTEGAEDGFYQVSALRAGLIWQTRSNKDVLILSSQVSLGLDVFGATNNNALPDGQFLTWQGQGRWVRALDESRNTLLVVNLQAQLTPDELLPSEQLIIGGIGTVRGYRQNLLIADSGITGSVEMRVPLFESESWGLLQLTPFFDFGTVWNNQNRLDFGTIASLGLGLRWKIDNFWQANIDYGIPLVPVRQRGDSLSEDGWHFQLQLTPLRF